MTTRQIRLLQFTAVTLVILGAVRLALILPGRATSNDFALYYLAAEEVRVGHDPYVTDLGPLYSRHQFQPAPELPHVIGAYPPLFLRLFAPLTWLRPEAAFVVWASSETIFLFAIFLLTRRLLREELPAWLWWWVCAAVIWSDAVLLHFGYSQMGLLLATLALAGFAWLRSGKPAAACVMIVIAGLLKLYPFALLPWFVWRGANTWRGRGRLAIVAMVAMLVFVSLSGMELWREFLQEGLPALKSVAVGSLKSITVPACILNFGIALWDLSPPAAVFRTLCAVAMGAGVVILATALILCCRTRGSVDAQFALLSVAMIAGALYGWPHYFVFLIFPVALMAARVAAAHCWQGWAYLVVVLLMLNSFEPPAGPFWTRHLALRVLAAAVPQCGLVLLGLFFGREVWRGRS